jgi:hypothetical protein
MGKIIFWLVVVFLILFVLRMINVSKLRSKRDPRKPGKAGPEAMVRCTQCGVFLPRPEARETPVGYRCNDPACTVRH